MNFSLRSLRAFVELAEVKKFTLAAERCHMTQSALSQAVARLERDFGVMLFLRNTRSVELTPEGERLLISARSILRELGAVTKEFQSPGNLSRGKFSMAIVPSLASYWLPDILRTYRASYPGIRIRIIDGASARCHELVQQGVVDFSLSSHPGSTSEFQVKALFDEALFVALPPGHPLRQHTVLTARDLRGVAFIHQQGLDEMLLRCGRQRIAARQWLRRMGTADVDVEVANIGTLAGLVEAGFGACITPACSLPLFANRSVVTVPIPPRVAVRTIYSSHRLDKALPDPAAEFLNMLQDGEARLGAASPPGGAVRVTAPRASPERDDPAHCRSLP